ncbi:triacylglycerol lipase [Amycolatopsis sp. WAC 04182]|uniref:esterase/lipase family protein n=1 Tax=Amycolatopsis sp. WAC 04182 TaxID=2203198 RepID=UPI000F7AD3B3|nr:lipase [Amycolatopsis sp. WAC 04182]
MVARTIPAILAVLLMAFAGVPAMAAEDPGPPLSAPEAAMDAAVTCTADIKDARVNPVLLVHGTGATPQEYWSWNYERALPALGVPVCTVALPERALISVPIANEYLVHAIRRVHDLSGRKVSVLGHSQGGTHILWSLRFWPDLPDKVDDVVALSGDFHGTAIGNLVCAGPCTAISWQARIGSNLLTRMTRDPLPVGPSYTTVQTVFDEIVTPAPQAGRLDGAANFTVQDFCPGRLADHVTMLADNVAWQVAVDALTHDGPAVASRIRAQCWKPFLPNVDLLGFANAVPTVGSALGGILGLTQPKLPAEPELPGYARP